MSFKKKMLSSGIVVALAATGAYANATEGLTYTYLEADYVVLDADVYQDSDSFSDLIDETNDGGGFNVEASWGFHHNWFVFTSYSDTEADFTFSDNTDGQRPAETDVTTFKLGLGYHLPLSGKTDLIMTGAYADVDLGQFNFGSDGDDITDPSTTFGDAWDDLNEDSSDGYQIGVGVRDQTTAWLELGGGVQYTDLNYGNGFSAYGNALFEINANFGVNLSVSIGDELNHYGLGVRYSIW